MLPSSSSHPARIPRKHSTLPPAHHPHDHHHRRHRRRSSLLPRDATSLSHVSVPDVTPAAAASPDHHHQQSPSQSNPPAGKVDSQARSNAPSVKSLRNHSRLASFGRIRSRGSVQHSSKQPPAPPGEAVPAIAPVSPSEASSHLPSDGSSRSNNSSATTLTDDSKSDVRTLDEKPSRPSFWAKNSDRSVGSNKPYNQADFDENYKRLVASRPHTMHQTSSKLLRMTEDDRPFTRVRIPHDLHFHMQIRPPHSAHMLST